MIDTSTQEVLVILDPNFGDGLRRVWPGRAIWIVTTPINEPVIRSLRSEFPNQSHLSGITGMTHYQEKGREGCLLSYLDAIDLHHGPMSTATPYTVMRVIGAALSDETRLALSDLGFRMFSETDDGFEATRTAAEAARIRD